MENSFNKKVALVTGGMGGLGTAICRRLHDAGFKVAATYSPGNAAPEGWLGAQRDDGYRFRGYKVDVADYADVLAGRALLSAPGCPSPWPESCRFRGNHPPSLGGKSMRTGRNRVCQRLQLPVGQGFCPNGKHGCLQNPPPLLCPGLRLSAFS
mgnify:CR=1 FL=1